MYKVLIDLPFASLVNEASATTSHGQELIYKYKALVVNEATTCALVNNFLREAQTCLYDGGVYKLVESLTNHLNEVRTSWNLASVCEAILANQSKNNLLNRKAAMHAAGLLEMNESDVVNYIRSGALKGDMYCEGIRMVAKSVFKDLPTTVTTTEYTVKNPVSFCESAIGGGVVFQVLGQAFRSNTDGTVVRESLDTSFEFKQINALLESKYTQVDDYGVEVSIGNHQIKIVESGQVHCNGNVYTTESFREYAALRSRGIRTSQLESQVLEACALLSEHYDRVSVLDNVAIYTTGKDCFVVMENGSNLQAQLLSSTHRPKWEINENAINTLEFIKGATGVDLKDRYSAKVNEARRILAESEEEDMLAALQLESKQNQMERIQALTEKFKNSPAHLEILSRIAAGL